LKYLKTYLEEIGSDILCFFAVRVNNEEESRYVQKRLFDNGYVWPSDIIGYKHLKSKYVNFNPKKMIVNTTKDEISHQSRVRFNGIFHEFSFEEFIELEDLDMNAFLEAGKMNII